MRRVALLVAITVPWILVPAASPQAAGGPTRLILTPAEGTVFSVEGRYRQTSDVCAFKQRRPLLAKYRGVLELEREPDGEIRIINALSFDHYLRGLAEVPLSWPTAALRAQIIAARSYALDAYRRGRAGAADRGYDICASDRCQVYRGATVELGPFGDRWVDAVAATRGKVLTYAGRVIQAFYFSTSDGHTRRSFPGGTPQPWLPRVSGRDRGAPLARWEAPIRLADLGAVLRARNDWNGGALTRVRADGSTISLEDADGRRAGVSRSEFRSALNAEAPCLFPARYPNPTGTQTGSRLPQTVPSETFTLTQRNGRVLLSGRGWGHGVGMSQWGAYAMARSGATAPAILRHFYGPARVERVREPRAIRVLAAEGLRSVRITVEGDVTVTTGTGSVLASGSRFAVRGGDALRIARGHGARLRTVLTVEPVERSIDAIAGRTIVARVEASRAALLRAVLRDAAGVEIYRGPQRSVESGRRRVRIPAAVTTDLVAGDYTMVIEGADGLDRIASEPVRLRLAAAPEPETPVASPDRARWIALAIAALAIALGARLARNRLSRR